VASKKKQQIAVDKNNVVLDQLEVIYLPVESIRPNSYNPNRQSDHDFTLLCKSIAADGFTQPIIVQRETREIVDGEHRWRACHALGFDEVPCVLTDMTPEQARIATLRHNRARGTEDMGLAADVVRSLAEVGEMDFAAAELMLDTVEVDRIIKDLSTNELAGLDIVITSDQLGPEGKGVTAFDTAHAVDLSGDERRAKEKVLASAKTAEEKQMSGDDKNVYRLGLLYTGEEGQLVEKVLQHLGSEQSVPRAVLALCERFRDRLPAGAA
jgi:ParB/RepB/Spo0J family partition protein